VFKSIGNDSKTRKLLYELKPRDLERHFFMCGQLLQRQKRKGFLHRIIIDDEKWIHYDNPKGKISWDKLHALTSTAKPNIHSSMASLCSVFGGSSRMSCAMSCSKSNETITGDRLQLMRLSRALKEKRPQYEQKYDKVILQHDNARPHVAQVVKTYLETLK